MRDCKAQSRAEFDRQAATYDKARYSQHAKKLYPFLLAQLSQVPHASVLDVGCGTGELLSAMLGRWPEGDFAGLDLSEKMLEAARAKLGNRAELVLGDAAALPFPDGRFQAVLCNDSFHHYPDPEKVLSEVRRVLQPGGVFLLGDCTAPVGIRGVTNLLLPLGSGGDVHLYSAKEITALLEREFHGVDCHPVDVSSYLAWGIR